MPHLQDVGGAVTKNLFLKDKKKKGLWLVSARHDRQVSSRQPPPARVCGASSAQTYNKNTIDHKPKDGAGSVRLTNDSSQSNRQKIVHRLTYSSTVEENRMK